MIYLPFSYPRACTRAILVAFAALVMSYHASPTSGAIMAGDTESGGIGYAFQATLGATETVSQQSHVGAWSWEDQSLFGVGEEPVGWTHTSNWYDVTLTSDSLFTLTIERDATVPIAGGGFRPVDAMFPSFTVWNGVDNDAMPDAVALALGYAAVDLPVQDHHTYDNNGAVAWAEDLSILDSLSNTTLESVSRAWHLPAGRYSIVIGSNALSETSPPRQGYRATFSTVPVPEPATALLAALAASMGLLPRRRAAT